MYFAGRWVPMGSIESDPVWAMPEQDAIDVLGILSLSYRVSNQAGAHLRKYKTSWCWKPAFTVLQVVIVSPLIALAFRSGDAAKAAPAEAA